MRNEFVPYDIALAMTQLGWGWHKGVMGWYCNTTQELRQDDNLPVGVIYAPLYQQAFRWLLDLVNKDLPYTDNYSISFDNKYWTIRLGGCTMEVDKSQDACLRKLIEICQQKN